MTGSPCEGRLTDYMEVSTAIRVYLERPSGGTLEARYQLGLQSPQEHGPFTAVGFR